MLRRPIFHKDGTITIYSPLFRETKRIKRLTKYALWHIPKEYRDKAFAHTKTAFGGSRD